MDNQELLDNLQGQKYINGYVVNEQVPNFVEVKKKHTIKYRCNKNERNRTK